jgi:undecaprenyl-diphosphatase
LDYLKAITLAIVEGVTEFLPISSTGHMILVEHSLQFRAGRGFAEAFEIIIQLPAIFAVILYFWRDLFPFEGGKLSREKLRLWVKVAVAVLPAVVMGLLFKDAIEEKLFAPLPVAIALLVGGVLLVLIERRVREHKIDAVTAIPIGIALLIGCFQCLALIPGTSRSAATIIGGILLGVSRVAAAEFSFFLAIPTMLGATVLTLAEDGMRFSARQWTLIAVGSVVSFSVAYASIAFLMRYIKSHSFMVFGYYRIVLALLVLLFLQWPFG